MTIDRPALRRAIYSISVRHDWANTLDTEDRTDEIADLYEELLDVYGDSTKHRADPADFRVTWRQTDDVQVSVTQHLHEHVSSCVYPCPLLAGSPER